VNGGILTRFVNSGLNNKVRSAILFIIMVGIFGALFFVLSHSIITVTGLGDEEKTIYLESENVEAETKSFSLTNDSKTLIVSKGFYSIRVVGQNKQSLYGKDLGGASKNEVSVEVKPQKEQFSLGKNRFDCAKYQEQLGTSLYYPCADYRGSVQLGTELINSPLAGLITEIAHNHSSENDEGHAEERSREPGSTIKPYGHGFLSAFSGDGFLRFQILQSNGKPSSQASTSIKDYKNKIDDYSLSTIDDGETMNFSVYSDDDRSLLLFENAADNSPDRVDLKGALGADKEVQLLRIASSDNFTFVFSSRSPEDTEGDFSKDGDEAFETEQKVIVVDTKNKKVVKIHEIPSKARINKIAASPDGKLALLPVIGDSREIYMITADSFDTQRLPHKEVKDMCWKDNESFYYSTVFENEIYERSVAEQASFLQYKNPSNPVRKISCLEGQLYFTIDNSRDRTGDLYHFMLSGQEQKTGIRTDSFLPLYISVGSDTLKLIPEGSSIGVEQAIDGDRNPITPSKEEAIQVIFERLKTHKVEPDSVGLIFKY
jgi:hypothetical protein